MSPGDEEFHIALAKRNRLVKRLAKMDRGDAPSTPDRIQALLAEIEYLNTWIDQQLDRGS